MLLLQTIVFLVATLFFLSVVATMVQYPWDFGGDSMTTDAAAKDYYHDAYDDVSAAATDGRFVEEEEYVRKARAHAQAAGIPRIIQSFVKTHGLMQGRALEVGAGSGLLQDAVERYVGLDVSSRAKRFFHRPFVEGSATALPFGDDTFDAVWSIWVLEHVADPEQALREIRRVVKNGGYILLRPAWSCDAWAADGYEVRPYSDFGLRGKLIKASIPMRTSRWYSLLYSRQVRLVRTLATILSGRPSTLHFRRLKPNYSKYWVTDSDAVVSLDFYEMFLWFTSRGDHCVNCPPRRTLLFGRPGQRDETLVIRVSKPTAPQSLAG